MTETSSHDTDWIQAWIRQQREQLERFSKLGEATQNAQLADQWRDLGRRWLDVVGAWHRTWAGPMTPGAGPMPRFSELIEQLLPLGPAREQAQAWRDLAAAQAECRKLEQELSAVLMRVQADALALLEQRVRERESLSTFRELYDLWVECGERVYAQVAHSDAYAKLQAALGNATIRVRAHQQKVVEYGLEQLDLPTRSELNTVHRQIRELREKAATLEAQLAASAAPAGSRGRRRN